MARPVLWRNYLRRPNIKNFGARELATKRAVLEQECTLDFEYTVGQIVGMGGFSGGLFGAQARPETVSEALAAADLEGFENRIYSRLSGGEKRRAQLARALCQLGNAPQGKALLLDEPAASLDPRAAHSAMKAAASAAEKAHASLPFSTTRTSLSTIAGARYS